MWVLPDVIGRRFGVSTYTSVYNLCISHVVVLQKLRANCNSATTTLDSNFDCSENVNATYKIASTMAQPTETTSSNELPMTPSPNHKPVTHNLVKHEKNIIHMANGCPIILHTSYPLTEFVSGSPPDSPTLPSETPTWDLTTYENRLRTFNDSEWKLKFITPSQMAKAGLYYMGKQDRVKCMFCSTEFDYWQRGDDPLVEHKRKSPECSFLKESQGYDVCGIYNSPATETNSSEETKKIQQFLDTVGVVQQIKAPKHKEYANFDTRLKTFDKCEKKMKQDTNTLCEAGFFYIGDGQNDQMLCFCCSQGLKDWEDDDEPWTEHARWSPSCSYVLLSKGKHFVDEACGVRSDAPKINQEELSKLISDHKDVSIPDNNIKVNATKRKSDLPEPINGDQVRKSLLEVRSRLSAQKDPTTIPDSMLCKICYKEEMKVAFIPCGHVIACIQCAMTLDQCAVCRQAFSMAMRVYVHTDEEPSEDPSQLPCSSSQCSDEPSDPMLCKVCHKEEMEAAFIPCRHVYACVKCASEMHECPVCAEGFCATMQVYL